MGGIRGQLPGFEIVTNAHLGRARCDRSRLRCGGSNAQLDLGVSIDAFDCVLHRLELFLRLHSCGGVLLVLQSQLVSRAV